MSVEFRVTVIPTFQTLTGSDLLIAPAGGWDIASVISEVCAYAERHNVPDSPVRIDVDSLGGTDPAYARRELEFMLSFFAVGSQGYWHDGGILIASVVKDPPEDNDGE